MRVLALAAVGGPAQELRRPSQQSRGRAGHFVEGFAANGPTVGCSLAQALLWLMQLCKPFMQGNYQVGHLMLQRSFHRAVHKTPSSKHMHMTRLHHMPSMSYAQMSLCCRSTQAYRILVCYANSDCCQCKAANPQPAARPKRLQRPR